MRSNSAPASPLSAPPYSSRTFDYPVHGCPRHCGRAHHWPCWHWIAFDPRLLPCEGQHLLSCRPSHFGYSHYPRNLKTGWRRCCHHWSSNCEALHSTPLSTSPTESQHHYPSTWSCTTTAACTLSEFFYHQVKLYNVHYPVNSLSWHHPAARHPYSACPYALSPVHLVGTANPLPPCGSCHHRLCHAAASTPGGSFVKFILTQATETKVIIGDADLKGGGDVREHL